MTCSNVVNDASCLIDIHKGGLLAELCNLPYCFIVPSPIREFEVPYIPIRLWQQLEDAGMITHELIPDEVGQALTLMEHHPGLSPNDCFCLITALTHSGILLTGDNLLRKVATANGLQVHGVLWVIDELDAKRICARSLLTQALEIWQGDNSVFLPQRDISIRLVRLAETEPRRRQEYRVRCP